MSQEKPKTSGDGLILQETDNVATILRDIEPGLHRWPVGTSTVDVNVPEPVPAGFKVAIRPIATDETIVKYGHVIGIATEQIPAGAMVHVHNTRSSVQ